MMKDYIFLAAILLLRFPQSYFNKKTSGMVNGAAAYFLYSAYSYLLAGGAALILLLAEGVGGISLPAFGISALGALSLALNLYCGLEALKSGVMVLASLAGSAGLLLPCIAGIFMFDEPMRPMQFVGIAVLIFSGWLLIGYSKEQKGAFTPRTLLLLLGSMLSNGMIMVAQKMFSKFLPDVSASVFSFLAFGLVGVGMLACLLLRLARSRSTDEIKKMPKKLFLYGIILSGILLVINQLATVAGRAVPSAVMFPINDGGATIISAVTAAIFFNEKLTARSVCGLLLGIASLMIINLC